MTTKTLRKVKVQNVVVTNDCAERGVKLVTDFLPSAKKMKSLESAARVVEANRKAKVKLQKKNHNVMF